MSETPTAPGEYGDLPDRLRELANRIARRAPLMSIPVNVERDGDCISYEAATAIEQLQARLEEYKEDAERYRHMRSSAEFQDRNGPGLYWYLPYFNHNLLLGERLDAAIDAARRKEGV